MTRSNTIKVYDLDYLEVAHSTLPSDLREAFSVGYYMQCEGGDDAMWIGIVWPTMEHNDGKTVTWRWDAYVPTNLTADGKGVMLGRGACSTPEEACREALRALNG